MAKRDWASVPPPLLCAVAERLIPEAYARLHAVCTDWASAVTPEEWEEGQCRSYYLPRSLHCPWLMVPSKDDLSNGCLTFLSLTESLNPYRIAAPDLFDSSNNRLFIFGSHAGWLAVADDECNASLINPLTRAHIPLPSFTTITMPSLRPVEVVRDPTSGSPIEFAYNIGPSVLRCTPDKFRWTYFRKLILSSSPSSDDYIVAFIFHYGQFLAFARAGDTAWTVLDRVSPKRYGYEDALFIDRKLYAVADNGQIDSFDFTQTETETVPQPELVARKITNESYAEPKYLIFSSGYLLQIRRTVRQHNIHGFRTSGFTILKLDLAAEQGEKHWITVHDLGCQSIFAGKSQSLLISTQKIPGVRHNCIYFTEDYVDWFVTEGRDSTRDMGVFDIKEGSCEFLYPAEAWLTWPPPIWFAPVLN